MEGSYALFSSNSSLSRLPKKTAKLSWISKIKPVLHPLYLTSKCRIIASGYSYKRHLGEGYNDLLNPKLKGSATADPSNSSSAFAQLTNMLVDQGLWKWQAWTYVRKIYFNSDRWKISY